jgi:DNA-3-methyladenine glycosylase II
MATSWFDTWQPVTRHAPGRAEPLRLAFPLDGSFEPVAVALEWQADQVQCEVANGVDMDAVRRQVARIFSLDVDASTYPEIGERDPALGRVMARFWGLHPVLFTSPYECAAWGVISQRISMRQAAVIQRRLVETHGHRLTLGDQEVIAFPTPEWLLQVEAVQGLSSEKVNRLHAVARAARQGLLDPHHLRDLGPEKGPESVPAIPGIGPFWSSGIYLRAAGVTDVIPQEPKALHALATLKGLDHIPAGAELESFLDPYRPWRMWACVLLRVAANRDPECLLRAND